MKLDEQQLAAITAEEPQILVIAGAGSGKTAVLIERIRYLINEKGAKGEDIVAITFTNAAADEMKERLKGIKENPFIGTIHSYANSILKQSFNTQKIIEREEFDELFKELEERNELRPVVKYLLVDEFQDINLIQYLFLLDYVIAENLFFVGDDWQNIYSWRGASVNYFLDMAENPFTKVYFLETNYRSSEEIVSFAMKFLKTIRNKLDKEVFFHKEYGMVKEYDYNDMEFLTLFKNEENYSDWFVLVRTNLELEFAKTLLKKNNIPVDTFRQGDFDNIAALKKRLVENSVKILTIHSAKGLENKKVAVIGAKLFNEEERRVSYVAATRASEALYWFWGSNKPKAKKRKYF